MNIFSLSHKWYRPTLKLCSYIQIKRGFTDNKKSLKIYKRLSKLINLLYGQINVENKTYIVHIYCISSKLFFLFYKGKVAFYNAPPRVIQWVATLFFYPPQKIAFYITTSPKDKICTLTSFQTNTFSTTNINISI